MTMNKMFKNTDSSAEAIQRRDRQENYHEQLVGKDLKTWSWPIPT